MTDKGDDALNPVASTGGAGGPFAPIADFGFLSDCETTALVAPSGSVEWMCLPRIDSPSVFGSILDRDAGFFRLGPAGVEVPAAQRYIPGTMVMETTWWTHGGWLVVTDALLMGPWHHEDERSHTHRRAPTDYDADHVLLRMVRCVNGQVQVRLDCMPVFDYGLVPADWEHTGDGYHEATARGNDVTLRLTSDMNIGFEGPLATARTLLKQGESRFVALSWSEHAPPRAYEEALERMIWTIHHWQHWLDRGDFPDHPWRSHLQRSALTLKGLTYAPTGAVVAAPTTSLPETAGGDRNWDYRFTWIRDSTMALWAFYTLGYDWEANDFFYFITDVAEAADGRLQIMYGVDGRAELPEITLDHLSGYDGARPVRIGNAAYMQTQHDVWGAIIGSIYLFVRKRDRLDDRLWTIVIKQVEDALVNWRKPDHGMWEVRGEPRHFTSSKVFCWVAASRGAELARIRGDAGRAERWQEAADEIQADVLANAVDERGVFTAHYDTTALDASALLIPLLGFLPPEDKRVRETVLAIAEELSEDDLVLRYRPSEIDDGFASDEGAFTICSFWLVSSFVMIGELERAKSLCQKLLSFASPLQLYAEEIDPHTGRHLGNFPQAFTHLSLINAVIQVIRAEQRERTTPFT
ncbi:glycoside hydrolase family 15 protein [Actinomadura sp. HBU206391]|uniref:glycoside hydrolase family 15 protein n=1 Tax=Actinomadura sp. HBU206391 TaxID=2731692 RepID=UPI00164F7B45|nr:glycoside hydrolase family 15 protein [Actinomadura sp. HBU206391]MBC6461293.1 glycoside hydrolase family 15 protein [Actinomadura sp. HBU206391]